MLILGSLQDSETLNTN